MAHETLDAFTRHQILLQRFAAGEGQKVNPYIRRADRAMREILLDAGDGVTTKKELNDIERAIRADVGGIYAEYVAELDADMDELTEAEIAFSLLVLSALTTTTIKTPSVSATIGKINTTPMGAGGTLPNKLKPFTASWASTETQRMINAIIPGLAEGRSTADLFVIVKGTKANRFTDGELVKSRRNAQTIAKTAVNHVATQAREAVYRANSDLIEGVKWVSVLDGKTTHKCRDRDGNIYPIDSGPRPPAHYACRSGTIPIFKEGEIMLNNDNRRPSVGSKGAKVVTHNKYHTWLKTQPAAFQDDVLGVAQGKLFRNGGLSPAKFKKLTSDNFGQPLTLKEIKVKDATAWGKANLD